LAHLITDKETKRCHKCKIKGGYLHSPRSSWF
jgi:hypothetical protein